VRIRVWGCRGSLASPGPETIRYGGNTACVEVRLDDDTLIILDAGTGIRPLGLSLLSDPSPKIHLFLSHLHLDHLEGLGFFLPVWQRGADLHIWGPPSPVRTLEQRVAQYFSPPLFPVHLSEIPAHPKFHDAPGSEVRIGSGTILSEPIAHRGPTVGWRISENGRSFAYLTDHEPAQGVDLDSMSPEWISGYQVAREADVLFHDAQYTAEEYLERQGWGHSSVDHMVAFSLACRVERPVMFHHDPLHTDDDLEKMRDHARALWEGEGGEGEGPELAHEGMEFDLSS
jgi:phosphoribosyl 1,2-cyclic phosphodiesterase